jgi:hypothetical protein
VNASELKCYDWLYCKYPNDKVEFNAIRHVFEVHSETWIARTLQTDRITFTRAESDYLAQMSKKSIVQIAVFSLKDEPIETFPLSSIDFLKHRIANNNIRCYITGTEQARSVGLTASQYNELDKTKELISNDFGKNYSFGDIIHLMCMGYVSARNVIMRESQPVIVNQQDETMADSLSQSALPQQ